jgi:RNA-directed DNA polymerase
MGVKRQQGSGDQQDLFDHALQASLRLGATGEGGTGPGACAEPQALAAWEQQRALTRMLMEEVASSANLNQAYKRVKANKGAAGVDAMSISELLPWIRENREKLIAALLDGSYQPNTVRGVEIPKPGGGKRQLGIPTVADRLIQQAILQVLEPILDPTFSSSSFGLRPGRSAHQALAQAQTYVADGREIVVDIDLEKFLDPVSYCPLVHEARSNSSL